MRKTLFILLLISMGSCGRQINNPGERIITVSIAPFKYFVEAIGGSDFKVNVMVPAGADPHIYEPFPDQINNLRKSVGYISDGFLGFETNWLNRFYETNKSMKKLSLGEKIDLLGEDHIHQGAKNERADPHYWVSPKCALVMATSIRDFLSLLYPFHSKNYDTNYKALVLKIRDLDIYAQGLFSGIKNRTFMIYHPNLAYLARDYGLVEVTVEYEGKEPPASRIKDLIDLARKDELKTIFVQREYDTKNARAIADEIGAGIKIIDPLSEDWLKSTTDIISEVHVSLTESLKR